MELVWQEEEGVYTLEEEPVLRWSLRWPRVTGGGRAGGRMARFYARVEAQWRQRWRREVYWLACLDLARCREQSRPFVPWRAALEGEAAQEDGRLSLQVQAREIRGAGEPCLVSWVDVWDTVEGAPVFGPGIKK